QLPAATLNLKNRSLKAPGRTIGTLDGPASRGLHDHESGGYVFWVLAQELQFSDYQQDRQAAVASGLRHRHLRCLFGLRKRVPLRLAADEGGSGKFRSRDRDTGDPRRSRLSLTYRAFCPAAQHLVQQPEHIAY